MKTYQNIDRRLIRAYEYLKESKINTRVIPYINTNGKDIIDEKLMFLNEFPIVAIKERKPDMVVVDVLNKKNKYLNDICELIGVCTVMMDVFIHYISDSNLKIDKVRAIREIMENEDLSISIDCLICSLLLPNEDVTEIIDIGDNMLSPYLLLKQAIIFNLLLTYTKMYKVDEINKSSFFYMNWILKSISMYSMFTREITGIPRLFSMRSYNQLSDYIAKLSSVYI